MSEKKEKKFRITMNQIVIIFIAMAAMAVCFFLGTLKTEKVTEITETTLLEQLKGISDLATVEYNYTNMAKFEKNNDLNGWTIPLTTTSFILSYDGQITAGIHLEEVKFDVNEMKIKVTVPEAEVLSHQMDEKSVKVFDESNSIFNPIKVSDYTTFSAQQKEVMEEKAVGKGLLTEAEKKAGEVISQILTNANPDYEVIIK